jgi:CDP-glucose 4,6-dehydratase
MPLPDLQFWTQRPVAVTGATGFLGSHLAGALVTAGAEVVALVRDDVPHTPLVAAWKHRAVVVRGDVTDQGLVERLLGDYQVRTVFHLAAQSQVGVANRNPAPTFDANIRGTWALLEAARRAPTVEQIVVASSDKAYGDADVLPYTEDTPLRPQHPYDVSKACADLLARSYHATFGMPVVITRCGNLFGPGDLNWDRLVPSVIRAALDGRRPEIRSDGTPVRDYLYVDDAVAAYLRMAEVLAEQSELAGEAFNVSAECPVDVLGLVERIGAAVGTAVEPDVRGTATGEIDRQHLDASKARRVLGWEPSATLDEALAVTVGWYRDWLAGTA